MLEEVFKVNEIIFILLFLLSNMQEKNITLKERMQALKLAISWTYGASKSLTVIIFIITIFGGLLAIVEPYILKIIIDKVVGNVSLTLLEKFGIGLSGIIIAYGIAKMIQSVIGDIQTLVKKIHSQRLDKYVAEQLMDKISSLDAVYFEDPDYYNTLTKANQNFWRINEFFWQFTWFLGQLISVLVIISALFTFNRVIVILVALSAIPSILFNFRATKIAWSAFDSNSAISREAHYYKDMMMNNPNAVKEIKLFQLKPYFLKKFDSLFTTFLEKQEHAAFKELALYVSVSIIEGIFAIVAAFIVIRSFLNNQLTIGELTFYWALLFKFAEHARHMVRMIGELNRSSVFIMPFVNILQFEPKIKEKEHALPFPKKLQKEIEFRNVTFYYPRAKRPALKNFNLFIKPGDNIAIVGENGSGKTTLIKLLARLYDVSEGGILIDGINIKKYSIKSLHENIGVIFQDFIKYESLVEENIGYGNIKELKKTEKIHNASLKAEAWDFIKELEQQYKTHVGKTLKEEGTELSVGQWQKIALARAFFKDAQILCLDEPTAAVDAKAEYQLFKKFENLTKGKTTILISHRFSTVRMAHKIIVLEKGKIVEQGSHQELLRKNGLYAALFKMQAEGYK